MSAAAVRVTTSPEVTAQINAMFDANAERLAYLCGRWVDETEYEDWTEYIDAMTNMVPSGFTITKISKRPFGFEFTVVDAPVGAKYRMSATPSGNVEWKRIA